MEDDSRKLSTDKWAVHLTRQMRIVHSERIESLIFLLMLVFYPSMQFERKEKSRPPYLKLEKEKNRQAREKTKKRKEEGPRRRASSQPSSYIY